MKNNKQLSSQMNIKLMKILKKQKAQVKQNNNPAINQLAHQRKLKNLKTISLKILTTTLFAT